MIIARFLGLVAGAISLHSFAAFAGEGTSLRGLKPPSSALQAAEPLYALPGERRPKKNRDELLLDFSRGPFLSGGMMTGRRVTANQADYTFALHQPIGQLHGSAFLPEPGIGSLGDLLPRYALSSSVMRSLPGGWGLGLGVRQTEYHFSTASLLSFSAERSFGNLRSAYTLYSNRSEASGLASGSAHRFEVSYLYGERNTIGLSYTTGRDIDSWAFPALSLSDVRDWMLSGRHWLSTNWALTYDVLNQEQAFNRRQGLRLGVSRSF